MASLCLLTPPRLPTDAPTHGPPLTHARKAIPPACHRKAAASTRRSHSGLFSSSLASGHSRRQGLPAAYRRGVSTREYTRAAARRRPAARRARRPASHDDDDDDDGAGQCPPLVSALARSTGLRAAKAAPVIARPRTGRRRRRRRPGRRSTADPPHPLRSGISLPGVSVKRSINVACVWMTSRSSEVLSVDPRAS